jgi:hypothetical protein
MTNSTISLNPALGGLEAAQTAVSYLVGFSACL